MKQGVDDFLARGGTLAGLEDRLHDELPVVAPRPERVVDVTAQADLDNSRRLAKDEGSSLRYAGDAYYGWDGRRWAETTDGHVIGLAFQVVDRQLREAWANDDRPAVRWATTSRNRSRLEAMVALARHLPPIHVELAALDADPGLLNCLDGTIDLRTGQLREHRRADLITKLAPVRFKGAQGDQDVEKFLLEIVPDEAKRAFLQKLVGMALGGRNKEERLLFIVGPTGTGKSTFLEMLRCALGDYAGVIPFKSLLDSRTGAGTRSEIVGLRGKRLVVASEVTEGERWDAGLIKAITGGEAITARRIYRDAVTFIPSFTPVVAANQTPRVDADDDAMWRRLTVIRFDTQVPRRDPRVKRNLSDQERCGGAVLRWAIAGYLAYQRDGLGEDPASVVAATKAYRDSQDRLEGFVADEVVITGDNVDLIVSRELYERYTTWCRDNGERVPLTMKAMGAKLRTRGCTPRLDAAHTVRRWHGIRWRTPNDDPDDSPDPTQGDSSDNSSSNSSNVPPLERVTKGDVASVDMRRDSGAEDDEPALDEPPPPLKPRMITVEVAHDGASLYR